MSRFRSILWLASRLVLLLAVAVSSNGQQHAAAQSIPPRVVLSTGGPTGQIRQLRFSTDSNRLYAAGLDKIVYVYEVGWNQGDGDVPKVTLTPPLHWEHARGNRGSIFSLAIHPHQSEMVIGGASARQQTGDIGKLDLGQGLINGCLPTPLERTAAAAAKQIGTEGHRFAVMSLDYSPSGNSLLSRDEYGGMFVWQRNNRGGFDANRLRAPNAQASRFRPLAVFVDDQKIVYSRQEGGEAVRLFVRSLRTGNEAPFTEPYHGRVAALIRDHRGEHWASADGQGTVYISDLRDESKRFAIQASLTHVTSVAFGGQNLVAVLSNQFIDGVAGQSIVELFDITTRQRVDSAVVSTTENSLALAVSPDGRFLAVSKEDPREILVYPLISDDGQPIARPLSGTVPVVAKPNVSPTHQLAISPDGKLLGFGTSQELIDRSLELETGEIGSVQPPRQDWKFPVTEPDGWTFTQVETRSKQLKIADPNGQRWTIDLDPALQGTYFSHCFLFNQESGPEPVGIAVGTENVNSIFVYRFVGNTPAAGGGTAPKLVRWFRDHTGTITSLIPSPDGRTLFSGSQDNTIKLWRIGGLFSDQQQSAFPQSSFWGCDFLIENGGVITRRVDQEGIAFARTLRDGDRITRIQGYDGRDHQTILDAVDGRQSADQILSTLGRVSILRQNLIHAQSVQPDGQVNEKKFIIRPSWVPFLTAFSNRDGEWAIWHPSGYFNASAAEGGGLFEWMILNGPDQPPRMIEGGFLAKEFERPDTIQKLLSGVSIQDALAAGGNPATNLAQTIASTPDVRVLSPEVGQSLPSEQASQIVATVNFGAAIANDYVVRGTIDGVRMPEPVSQALANNQFQYTWTVTPTGRLNQIEVIADERGGALASLYASDVAYRRGETANPTPYRLHILSLASENYAGPLANQRAGFGKLEFPIDDVEAIVETLQDKQAAGLGRYEMGNIRELRDNEITQDAVRNEIRTLNDKLRGDDHQILIVYLSGHGTTIDGEYHYVTTSTKSADEADLRKGSIPWSLLDKAGTAGNRIVYMIDTCHSGTAVDAKSSIRDPLRSGGIVIAAASGREAAKELAPLQHGCFTFSVLAALDGDADGVHAGEASDNEASQQDQANGVVDLGELVTFVRTYVRQLTAGEQKPTATPSRLTDTLQIELVKTTQE